MATPSPCPVNSFRFNSTLCACNPGYFMNSSTNSCTLFQSSSGEWLMKTGIDDSLMTFPAKIFSFDSIKRFSHPQAVFLEATLLLLLSWLLFCFLVRFGKPLNGTSVWFRIRWWISRLDICFATRHWLDDQKVVMKRKTELGGTFSVASWILFIGLFAALLFQIITKGTVEVNRIIATNAPDLLSFVNDLEFNITTISSMSCSHLRGLGNLVSGMPGFVDYRVYRLSIFVNYSCHNTSQGPTISLKCNNCQIIRDNLYISWQFVDLPNDPATAVGFQFKLTAKNHADSKHVSLVTGVLKNGSNMDNRPVTYRGANVNVLRFNLFPRLYRNLHDLRLIQPLFHDFIPGSSFTETTQLKASLQNFNDGLINTTLHVDFLSSYIVEIDNQKILGPVGFLADLGGLYAISIAIFFYLLLQCEYKIKKFRNEDAVLQSIRKREKAQQHWDNLRKYVMYTWGSSTLDDNYDSNKKDSLCAGGMIGSFCGTGSSQGRKQQRRMDSIGFNRKDNLSTKKNVISENTQTQRGELCSGGAATSLERRLSYPEVGHVSETEVLGVKKEREDELPVGSRETDVSQPQMYIPVKTNPSPPVLEFKSDSGMDMSEIQKNIQNLYEFNVILREKLAAAQTRLEALERRASAPETELQN